MNKELFGFLAVGFFLFGFILNSLVLDVLAIISLIGSMITFYFEKQEIQRLTIKKVK